MNTTEFVSKELCVKLKNIGFRNASKYYYEWIGSDEVEETRDGRAYYLPDNINVYTSVAINENVTEIGYKKDDSLADKRAKLLIWLAENGIIII